MSLLGDKNQGKVQLRSVCGLEWKVDISVSKHRACAPDSPSSRPLQTLLINFRTLFCEARIGLKTSLCPALQTAIAGYWKWYLSWNLFVTRFRKEDQKTNEKQKDTNEGKNVWEKDLDNIFLELFWGEVCSTSRKKKFKTAESYLWDCRRFIGN